MIHEYYHTTQEKQYPCVQCNKIFLSTVAKTKHSLKVHNMVDVQDKGLQKRHKKMDGESKSLSCKMCNKSFTSKAGLEVHEKAHAGDKPHKCQTCDKRFTQIANLQHHERIHKGIKPFQCEFCDKKFTQKANLQHHERIHTGDMPFQCKVCEKRLMKSFTVMKSRAV